MDAAILLRGVRKTFGSTAAVRDLDLIVPRGALYGFIGPNGAGKTTSIRMIMSILFPDAGELSVLGHRSALEAKDRIGYLPEERGVYRKMRVGAFLTFMGHLKGLHKADLPQRVQRALERVGLAGTERKRCEELSKGMLQKVQFVAAILHEPDLLILDEPFSGLDPVSTRQLRDLILAEHRRGATILFSTHVMTQAEEMCQHVVMIHRGRKVLDEDITAIRRQYDPRAIRFEPLDPGADPTVLRSLAEVERIDRIDGSYEIHLVAGTDPGSAMQRITMAIAPARIELSRPRLEDVFIGIVADEAGAGESAQQLRADLRDLGASGATA
ncbi:MAG: ATP-binding cassette domain-containing protein [Acidobacteriota bacterium]